MSEDFSWLSQWFVNRGAITDTAQARPETNYFEAEWIDSFGVLELIAMVEEHRSIRFDEEHFRDRRFVTVGGLAEMIGEIRAAKSEHVR